jgi:16S rRNA (guanine527-N7)-methyltransferase
VRELLRKKADLIPDLDPAEGNRLLTQGAESLGIALSSRQLDQFRTYLTLLDKWNQHINLTGIRSHRQIILKHFLDSLTPVPFLSEDKRLLDLGTGAGFPGLPIKIVHPNQPVTLIEASAKKVSFLKEATRQLKLGPVFICQTYLGEDPHHLWETDLFDIVVSRAVGKTINLLTAADPYLRSGGKVLFMKGPNGSEEMFSLKDQIEGRGFQIETPIVLASPLLDQERTLIFITKVGMGNG